MEWIPTLQGNYGPNMNAFWYVVAEIYTTWETLTQNLDTNSMRRNPKERKDENYKPLSINAGGIKILF